MYYSIEFFNKKENKYLLQVSMYILAVYIIGLFVGSVITYYDTTYKFKKQAIEHGYAEYDNKTGEWEWKNSQTLNTEP